MKLSSATPILKHGGGGGINPYNLYKNRLRKANGKSQFPYFFWPPSSFSDKGGWKRFELGLINKENISYALNLFYIVPWWCRRSSRPWPRGPPSWLCSCLSSEGSKGNCEAIVFSTFCHPPRCLANSGSQNTSSVAKPSKALPPQRCWAHPSPPFHSCKLNFKMEGDNTRATCSTQGLPRSFRRSRSGRQLMKLSSKST